MKLDDGVRISRIYLVDGPHKGEVVPHELARGPYLRRRALRGLEVRETLYRIFVPATLDARDVADHFAGKWREGCDMLGARCRHAFPQRTRRWARFGPRFDRTRLDPDAPGSRESKWHLLRLATQASEPWLTACDLIVYGPILEGVREPSAHADRRGDVPELQAHRRRRGAVATVIARRQPLSARECAVLRLLADGLVFAGVARSLGISEVAARTYARRARTKLRASTTIEAAVRHQQVHRSCLGM